MTGQLQPLVNNQPIVRSDGTPTDYFIRWAQQKQIDLEGAITAEQALEIIQQYLFDHQLQEGSGIQITPNGNISDSPTIAAEVQAILDQITNVQGSILFRSATGWEDLAPGTAGWFLKTNGAGADPAWAASGGGGGGAPWWFSPPLAASLTATSGDGTLPTMSDDTDVGLLLNPGAQVSGNKARCALLAITGPTVDWTAECQLDIFSPNAVFCLQGMFLRNSTTGKLYIMGRIAHAFQFLVVQRVPALTGGSITDLFADDFINTEKVQFFRMVYTAASTTYTFFVSENGKQWLQIASAGITDHFGTGNQADQIGFGVCYDYTSPAIQALMTCGRFVKSW